MDDDDGGDDVGRFMQHSVCNMVRTTLNDMSTVTTQSNQS